MFYVFVVAIGTKDMTMDMISDPILGQLPALEKLSVVQGQKAGYSHSPFFLGSIPEVSGGLSSSG